MRSIALVTFSDAAEGQPLEQFTTKEGIFTFTKAPNCDLLATVWWAFGGHVFSASALDGEESLTQLMLRVNQDNNSMGAFTWFSPHAFSVLARILHWERIKYDAPEDYKWLLRAGIIDIVDAFYTPEQGRSTLTSSDRTSANLLQMASVLPNLAGTPLRSPKSQASFLLRLCYATSNIPCTF